MWTSSYRRGAKWHVTHLRTLRLDHFTEEQVDDIIRAYIETFDGLAGNAGDPSMHWDPYGDGEVVYETDGRSLTPRYTLTRDLEDLREQAIAEVWARIEDGTFFADTAMKPQSLLLAIIGADLERRLSEPKPQQPWHVEIATDSDSEAAEARQRWEEYGQAHVDALRRVAHWYDETARDYRALRDLGTAGERLFGWLNRTPHIADESAAECAAQDLAERGGDLAHACRTATGSRAIEVWSILMEAALADGEGA